MFGISARGIWQRFLNEALVAQHLSARVAYGVREVARELLLESVTLSLAGGTLGLLLTYGVLRILATSGLPHLPRIRDISLDPVVLAFALGISLTTGLVFDLIPALKYARPRLSDALRNGGRSLSQGKEPSRARAPVCIASSAS